MGRELTGSQQLRSQLVCFKLELEIGMRGVCLVVVQFGPALSSVQGTSSCRWRGWEQRVAGWGQGAVWVVFLSPSGAFRLALSK